MEHDKFARDPLHGGELLTEDYQTLPSPFDDLVGVEVHIPGQGRGWVGFDLTDEGVAFWHVKKDTCTRILFDRILRYVDPSTDNSWLVFEHEVATLIVLINPEDSFGVETYVPPAVREYIVART